ncbi:MAG: hypothetical protein JWQ09_6038 [Segetibacter sp.]|nr:hypothetical protein [Segetibacter sp.]
MNNPGNIDVLAEYKKLLAAKKSQEARLEEYAAIVSSRDREIEMLQSMLSDATAYRSSMDNESNELKNLQLYLKEMQQHSGASVHLTTGTQQHPGNTVSARQQLQQLQLDYASLQSQLSDMQAQLLEMNHRNLLLQQQNSRIAELESLLANTEEDINLSRSHIKR